MSDLFQPIAFAAGMVALLNPCGFALLPAYLGYFLGMSEGRADTRLQALNRSQLVGLSMSLGFLVVFGILGLAFSGLRSQLQPILPWFSMAIGVALVILGVAMVRGFKPMVSLPKLERGTGGGSVVNMFLFGISYAIASLSCTIGVFLAVVGTSATGASFSQRFGGFLSYGIGMGLLATVLTIAVGFGKQGVVSRFRRLLPKINLISGIILIPVGAYVFLYGVWDYQVLDDPRNVTGWIDGIIVGALDFQADISTWVDRWSTQLGWVFLALNLALIAAGLVERALRTSGPEPATSEQRQRALR